MTALDLRSEWGRAVRRHRDWLERVWPSNATTPGPMAPHSICTFERLGFGRGWDLLGWACEQLGNHLAAMCWDDPIC